MLRLVEQIYVVSALIYFSAAFSPHEVLPDPTQGDTRMLLLQTAVYAIAAFFTLRHWGSFVRGLRNSRWALLLAGMALCSAVWSEYPLLTLRKGVVVLGTTMFGAYFAAAYRRDQQLRLLCIVAGLLAALSAAAAVLYPSYGIDPFSGDWCGVFPQKNSLGRFMVLGGIAFLLCSGEGGFARLLRGAGVSSCLAVLLMSGSRGALIALLLFLVVVLMNSLLRVNPTTAVPIFIAIVLAGTACAAFALENADAALLMIGRDVTLTGRTQLWQSAWLAILQKPWLGYGFNSFWMGLNGPSSLIMSQVSFLAPHAHNGYLDLCLDLGFSGLGVFAVGWAARLRTAVREYRFDSSAAWPLLYLAFMLVYNLGESNILRANSIFWVLYVTALADQGSRFNESTP